MAQIETTDSPTAELDPKEIHSPADVEDQAALTIVLKDAEFAKSWLDAHYFNIRWLMADVLYQSPPILKVWEGSTIPRADVRKFTVATHVNAIKNKLIGGLFYEEPPFKLLARPSTDANTIRAIEEVQGAQLDMMNFRQEVKYGIHSALLFGTGLWKWSWSDYEKTEWEFERSEKPIEFTRGQRKVRLATSESDKFVKTPVKKQCSHPCFESVDIRFALVDPSTRTPDARDAKFIIHEMAWTYRDLCKKKDETYIDEDGKEIHRYNLPAEETIKAWFTTPPVEEAATSSSAADSYSTSTNYVHHAARRFEKTTEDPLDEPLKVLERWDEDKVITIIQDCLTIRNEPNPYSKIPFFSVNWWDISDAFWGIGLGTSIGSEQMLQQGLTNAVIDVATLAVNQPMLRLRGANINPQQTRLRLGGDIAVDIPTGSGLHIEDTYHPLELPKIPQEAMGLVELSESRTEQTSGASEQLTMGATPSRGKTSLGRTATGAGGMMAAAESRLAGFVEDFNRQVYQPWLWQMHDLNCQFLPMSVLREILNDELGEAFQVDEKKYLNAGIKEFEVLAGSHLAVKQQIAQAAPILVQNLLNPALQQSLAEVSNEYIDISELIHMVFDVAGGKNYYSIIKPLTPEMKQKQAANSPAAIAQAKTQAQGQQLQKKHLDKKDLLEQQQQGDLTSKLILKAQDNTQENLQRANNEVDRQEIEQTETPEAITGQPGGEGFGSNVES